MGIKNKTVVQLLDAVFLLAAFFLTTKIRAISNLFVFKHTLIYELPNYYYFVIVGCLPVYYLFLYIFGFYEANIRLNLFVSIIKHLVLGFVIFSLLLSTAYFLNLGLIPRSILITFLFLNFVSFIVFRILLYIYTSRKVRRVLVIGEGTECAMLLKQLRKYREYKFEITGVVSSPANVSKKKMYIYPVLGTYKNSSRIIKEKKAEIIIISVGENNNKKQQIIDLIDNQVFKKIQVYISPSLYEIMLVRPEYFRINDFPLLRIKRVLNKLKIIKRTADFCAAFFMLLVLWPLLLVIYLLVKLTSPGPGIFKQERIGRNQNPFMMYKFRTMYTGYENDIYQAKNKDKRITRIGKYLRYSRLDEFPQLLNILKGNMSFVGPRPLVKKEVTQGLSATPGYRERFIALPGVTGLAQVHGDYHTKPEQKIKYDLWYIYHYSILLDISIVLRTVKTMLLVKGT